MPKRKVLLIDDESSICFFTKLNLERTGEYEVTVAYSGEEGLKKAQESDFDLVITDYRMPGMDGKQVLDALKANDARRPVILFSIYHDDASEVTQEIRRRADGIISKPIDTAQLHQSIRKALAKHEAAQASKA